MISDEYRRLNAQMHSESKFTGPDALAHIPAILECAAHLGAETVLDYGCGCAVLADLLPLSIQNYDPAIESFSRDPLPADLVVSIDVLEHVEPEMLAQVLEHIRSKALKGAYLHISLVYDGVKLMPDGRNPHLLVMPSEWWIDKLSGDFEILQSEITVKHKKPYSLTVVCR